MKTKFKFFMPNTQSAWDIGETISHKKAEKYRKYHKTLSSVFKNKIAEKPSRDRSVREVNKLIKSATKIQLLRECLERYAKVNE